jgi:hypothetical protein
MWQHLTVMLFIYPTGSRSSPAVVTTTGLMSAMNSESVKNHGRCSNHRRFVTSERTVPMRLRKIATKEIWTFILYLLVESSMLEKDGGL